MTRNIDYLVIHTTAGSQKWDWTALRAYFIKVLKWRKEGYHVTIQANGTVKRFMPDSEESNGIRPFRSKGIEISNSNSVHVSWIGGIDQNGLPVDNRTDAQKDKLADVIQWYADNHPGIKILGHCQVALKGCPCFSVPDFCDHIGIPDKNIYRGDHFNVMSYYNYTA